MDQLFTLSYYSESETLHIPNIKDVSELDIGIDLACHLNFTKLEQEEISTARARGELSRERGKIRLLAGNKQVLSSQTRPVLYLGRVNLEILLNTLQKSGMKTRVEEVANEEDDGSERASFLVRVMNEEPKEALIEVTASHTVISTADDNFASCISEAISSILDCIS